MAEGKAVKGSEIYHRAMELYESDPGQDAELQHKVWDGTPWIAEVYIGDINDRRERDMFDWCRERFGEMSRPFGKNPQPGQWRAGNAVVCGWAWFGFATEEQMREFEAAWPAPKGVKG